MASLELTATIFEASLLDFFPTSVSKDKFHVVLVSERAYKVITGSNYVDCPAICEVRSAEGSIKVVVQLIPISSINDSSRPSVPPGTILMSPNLVYSLDTASGRVTVTQSRSKVVTASEVILSEVCGPEGHSDKIHALVLSRYFSERLILCVGETIGVPVWPDLDAACFNEISEPEAGVRSWIGPGRALDTTRDVVYYRVVEFKGEAACFVDSTTRVIMTAPRQKGTRGRIPDMRRYIFPTIPARFLNINEELCEWMQRGRGPAVIVKDDSSSDESSASVLECVLNSAEKEGYFIDVVNCRLHASLSFQPAENAVPKTLKVLDNFEELDEIFSSSWTECTKILFLTSDYKQAVKKVGSPFRLGKIIIFEAKEKISNSVVEGYKVCCNNQELVQTLERRLAERSHDDDSVPTVDWDDIGGLETAKEELRELVSCNLRRGLLLYGPPGTGKTLLAKAIATQAARRSSDGRTMKFIGVKGPELLSMYIGESEKNVREIFNRAKNEAPCVVFFDELDSLAPARGRATDSANVMDRVVASLLSELDNLPTDVIIVGATNRPDLLDPALLRPGRIDRQVYIGVPRDKKDLVVALMRKFPIVGNIEEIAKHIPSGMTGSDLAGAIRRAYLQAAKSVASTISQLSAQAGVSEYTFQKVLGDHTPQTCGGITECEFEMMEGKLEKCWLCGDIRIEANIFPKSKFQIKLNQQDLLPAILSVKPSVSESELAQYEKLRDAHATVIG